MCSEPEVVTEAVGTSPETDTLAPPLGNPLMFEEMETLPEDASTLLLPPMLVDEEMEDEDEEVDDELWMLADPDGPPNPDMSTEAPFGPAETDPPKPPNPADAVAESLDPPADALPPNDDEEPKDELSPKDDELLEPKSKSAKSQRQE